MSITRLLECCPREEPVVETCSLKFPSCHEPPAHAGIRPSERTPASLMFHARDSDPHNDTTSRLRGETACKSEWAVRKRLQSANGSLPLLSDNSSKFSSRKSLLITEKQAASAYFSTWSFRLCYCHGKNLQDVLSLFLDPATIVDLLHSNESSPPLKPSKEGFASFAVDGIGLLGASTPPRTKKRWDLHFKIFFMFALKLNLDVILKATGHNWCSREVGLEGTLSTSHVPHNMRRICIEDWVSWQEEKLLSAQGAVASPNTFLMMAKPTMR